MKKKKGIVALSIGAAALMAFTATLNALSFTVFDEVFTQFFGTAESTTTGGDGTDLDTTFYKKNYKTVQEMYAASEAACTDIAKEGVTLLKNENKFLPLAKNTEISVFSHSSVDIVSGGSGSGAGSFELTKDLKEGLETAGLKVNQKLWDFYKSGNGSSSKGYKRGDGSINYGANSDWKIREVPLSVMQKESGLLEDAKKNKTAMFVVSRTGGEGVDEGRDMAQHEGKAGQHYLELDDNEKEIVAYLNDNFENVIILVNANNAMELGWVNEYSHIKAVVNFPGAGRTGTIGLGYVLTGLDEKGNQFSPSGHLVDTFVYDNFSSPASQNIGNCRYEGTNFTYVAYNEGIYVGYKYYETRYADKVLGTANVGSYDYDSTVLYPFGYGLSYTSFNWSDFKMTQPDSKGDITVTVKVTNSGDRAGKDVVQLYSQTPWTAGQKIEKSAVNLVGFAKTGLLAKGASETVSMTVNLKDLTSYDYLDAKTYVLDAGMYYLTAAQDAHKAVNNILKKQAKNVDGNDAMVGVYSQATTDKTSYSMEGDVKVTNQFDHARLEDVTYLSRSNWTMMDNLGLQYGTRTGSNDKSEKDGKALSHSITDKLKSQLQGKDSLNPNTKREAPTLAVEGDDSSYDWIDLRGVPYDDPMWDKLLEQLTTTEINNLVRQCGYQSPAAKSINKPKAIDFDGPAGLNKVVGHGSVDIGGGLVAMTWPTEYLLACTWNEELALKLGQGVGEDGLWSGTHGWYGPAMNIHRTPFSGRNFEYYSEDGYISGVMGRASVQGAAQKGVYGFIKHFALNDQETNRTGVATWSNEQAIREIYLKPFYMCIKDNNVEINYNKPIMNKNGHITGYEAATTQVPACMAVMSSFNRVGATWSGGNYNLLHNVMRTEWGFNGFILTDYDNGGYMDATQMLQASGDAKLSTTGTNGANVKKDASMQAFGLDAAHHILYCTVNSSAANGLSHGVVRELGFAYYKLIIIAWDVLAAAGLGVMGFFLYKKLKGGKEGE